MLYYVANLLMFIFSVYIRISGRSKVFQGVVWSVTLVITSFNIYGFMVEEQYEKPFVDLITPNISSIEAFKMVKRTFKKELEDYHLVDIIGSYYICLKKPDTIFHRFPEWVFVFRHKLNDELIEIKISDEKVPPPPKLGQGISKEVKDGYFAYYIVTKSGYSSDNFLVDLIDMEGKCMISYAGRGPDDDISETNDGINSKVLARVQLACRDAERVSSWREIDSPIQMSKFTLRKAELPANKFHSKLSAIKGWKIDNERAIQIALKKGAKGIPPGKEGVGGPGVIRLYCGERRNLNGLFWNIPYRIKIIPLLIDGYNAQLYGVNREGEYSIKFSISDWDSD